MFYALNMNPLHTVYANQKKREKWYFVNVALSGTTVNVLTTNHHKQTKSKDGFVTTVKFFMNSKEKQLMRLNWEEVTLKSIKLNLH